MSTVKPDHQASAGQAALPTSRVLWRIIRYQLGYFLLALTLGIIAFGSPLAVGLVTRAFFDGLTGGAPAASVWGVIALFAIVAAVDQGANIGLSFAWASLLYTGLALLRGNVLRQVLHGYGARVLPASSGEAVNRFRDDAEEVGNTVDAWIDIVGRSVFVTAALAVMLRTDVVMTLAVFV